MDIEFVKKNKPRQLNDGTWRKQMKRVEQTNAWNCGSACLAMIFDCTVGEIEKNRLRREVGKLRDPKDDSVIGVTPHEIEMLFWQYGVRYVRVETRTYDPEGGGDWYARTVDCLPLLFKRVGIVENHLLQGGIALVGVASLENEGGSHWIVGQGRDLFDPSRGEKRYTRLSAELPLAISEAFLLE